MFLVARAVFGLSFLAVALGSWPVPWYHPMERTWEIVGKPSTFGMGWFGSTGFALVASILAAALAWRATARGPLARAITKGTVVLALAHAGALVLLVDYAYFGWKLTHQVPKPLVEPTCPR